MSEHSPQRPTILIVDDTPDNIDVLAATLRNDYDLKVATNGKKALHIAQSFPKPEMILLDVMMPEMDGYEVCRQLKANPITSDIPVLFVTAKANPCDEEQGFALGAVDYITKPISPPRVKARVRTHIALYNQNRQLQDKVKERTQSLERNRLRIIHHLGRAVEYKDNETGAHVIRMSHYSRLLAEVYGGNNEWVEMLFNAAPMHDVGKIGIADSILLKPGKLDPDEWEIMKQHTLFGAKILGDCDDDPMLKMAEVIALTHHEKWDGTGYPYGLKGDSIPLEGRIVAIADVLDALLSKRPYKEAWSLKDTMQYMNENAGKHFDPKLIELLPHILPEIEKIRTAYPD
ncbi:MULTISPECIES: response regulator [Marinomonas]|uniref:Two-component system response regulator n=1 Tax=Marinomonas rhodophyticola TaxID=2992803 RepID=A0ABT3KJ78_9GAMM|nr:two-component system response regulator [Marinomonas sp. KJ51-3]MCW4630588.1 two-component system response regulator [Marinomonas sp. KJ51-3]